MSRTLTLREGFPFIVLTLLSLLLNGLAFFYASEHSMLRVVFAFASAAAMTAAALTLVFVLSRNRRSS